MGGSVEREAFRRVVGPVVNILRGEWDTTHWAQAYRVLKDVSEPVLTAAMQTAAETLTFVPTPAELKTLTARARAGLLEAHPYHGCESCVDSPGWVEHEVDGVTRAQRCVCWTAHQATLGRLGLLEAPGATTPSLVGVGAGQRAIGP